MEFHCGVMKAGKTKQLIQRFDYIERLGMSVGVFAYSIAKDENIWIESRDKNLEPLIAFNLNLFSVEQLREFIPMIENEYDQILIDEVQFAPVEHLKVFKEMNAKVHLYGLYEDYKGNVFESTKYLLSNCELSHINNSYCDYCGDVASHNIRMSEEEELFVEEKEVYATVCDNCRDERK